MRMRWLCLMAMMTACTLPAVAQDFEDETGGLSPLAGLRDRSFDAAPVGAGVMELSYNPLTETRLVMREGMTTTIVLPSWEVIDDWVIGSDVVKPIELKKAPRNTLTVFGALAGPGTSIQVFGSSGRVYVFYARVEDVLSPIPPHLLVRVRVPGPPIVPGAGLVSEAQASLVRTEQKAEPPVRKVPDFADPEKARALEFRYALSGGEASAPDVVFSDGVFTYLWYDPQRWTQTSFPAPFRVVDGVDVPAQFETDGTTIILKDVGAFTLRVGDQYTCIRPNGWTVGERHPVPIKS